MEEHLCEYGCGRKANYQFKNGKWCCSKNAANCPEKRKKIIEGQRRWTKTHPEKVKQHNELMKEIMKGNSCWNRGLTKNTNKKIFEITEHIKDMYKNGDLKASFKGKTHTEQTKQKISKKMKGNHNNNPNKTGKGRKGYYKGFYCSSTYELAFVIFCLDHNIKIKRCLESFDYEYKGVWHKYFPDFVINNDVIIEIKGYWTEVVSLKENVVRSSGKKYHILYFKDMKNIFKYIENVYGKCVDKNLHELYENN